MGYQSLVLVWIVVGVHTCVCSSVCLSVCLFVHPVVWFLVCILCVLYRESDLYVQYCNCSCVCCPMSGLGPNCISMNIMTGSLTLWETGWMLLLRNVMLK